MISHPNFNSSQFQSHYYPPPRPPNPTPLQPAPPNPFNTHPQPNLSHLPKMHLSKFDGDDPQYWMTCAQNYFDLYGVVVSMWVKCSTMQFTGAARCWFQSIERDLMKQDWPNFYRVIC
jgi:hypothetical protein